MNHAPGEIERELESIRRALARNAHAAASDARTLTDWKYHFRAHPWLFCGTAAAVGFWLAPGRGKSLEDAARAMLPQGGSEPEGSDERTPAQEPSGTRTMAAAVLGAVASRVAQQALNYALARGLELWQERQDTRARHGARATMERP